jgi:hypothetical protein
VALRSADRRRLRFGLTESEYEALMEVQGGKCAICYGNPNGRWSTLSVDHDHQTKRVRGLLCTRCNRAIGLLHDNAVIAGRLAAYLKKWRKKK